MSGKIESSETDCFAKAMVAKVLSIHRNTVLEKLNKLVDWELFRGAVPPVARDEVGAGATASFQSADRE